MDNVTSTPTPAVQAAAPAPAQSLPPLKQLFKDSWELCKKRWLTIFLSLLMPILIVAAGAAIGAVVWVLLRLINSTLANIVGLIFIIALVVAYFGAVLLIIASPWTALRDAAENTGWRENLKRAYPLIGSALLVAALLQLIVMGGMVLFIIPGIVFGIYYGFAPIIMVAEGKKGRAALAQSRAYVEGRGWAVLWRMLALQLSLMAIVFALQLGIEYSHQPVLVVILTAILIAVEFIFTYFAFAYQYTLYLHLKNSAAPGDGSQYVKRITGWAIWGVVGILVVMVAIITIAVFVGGVAANSHF